ncbi:hypothetical protein [Paraburkholderia sp. SIMBA_054]|uniref:hypothetical protein n=1 Tax=Paraburkholderia sp. SIMBA_054 TaxID=3085795 RepID=UPI003979A699
MNAVDTYLSQISEEDIRIAVGQMKELELTAVLCDGVVRRHSAALKVAAGIPDHDARKIIEKAVYRMAAFKWAGV